METLAPENERTDDTHTSLLTLRGIARALRVKGQRIFDGLDTREVPSEPRWRKDRLSLIPLYDRGGAISLTPSADADLGWLAEIELQLKDEKRARAADIKLED